MKKILLLLITFLFPFVVYSKEITTSSTITLDGVSVSAKLLDNKDNTYALAKKGQVLKITNKDNIKGLYIIYELNGGKGSISNGEKSAKIGENDFMHDYIDVEKLLGKSKTLTIKYDEDIYITDIHVIGEGEIPSFVELWEKPAEEADLLLFTTHSDDEQLFFLGLLPTYVARGASVQVVYFTNHRDNIIRYHERLHGLYTVGIRHYPVVSSIPDAYSMSLEAALKNLTKAGLTEADAINFQVEMIRRFKPQVIVDHDEKGEYGHGQHQLNTYALKKAVEYANDETYHKSSYEKYGTWDAKKVYIHLYDKNKIVMDYDTPLDYFNGKTAYQVSVEGFKKHNSQIETWFYTWMVGEEHEYTKATQIDKYSPLEYGLYRTTVGEDKNKNDMFENLSFYKDMKKASEVSNEVDTPDETIEEKTPVNKERIIALSLILVSGVGILILVRKFKIF